MRIIYSFLAQVAYKFEHYQIAKKAAEFILTQYIDKNEVKYRQLDVSTGTLFTYRLNYKMINASTPTTIRQVIE